jgi:hypothetical protein
VRIALCFEGVGLSFAPTGTAPRLCTVHRFPLVFRRSDLGKAPPTPSFAMRPLDDEWGEVIPMRQVGVGLHI